MEPGRYRSRYRPNDAWSDLSENDEEVKLISAEVFCLLNLRISCCKAAFARQSTNC